MNNDSFAMIEDIIGLYIKGLLSVQETTYMFMQETEKFTWFITDPDIKQKAFTVLYKRFFIRMNKAINSMERR